MKWGQTGTKANYVGVEADLADKELHLFTLERGSKKVKPIRYQLWMEYQSGWNLIQELKCQSSLSQLTSHKNQAQLVCR